MPACLLEDHNSIGLVSLYIVRAAEQVLCLLTIT